MTIISAAWFGADLVSNGAAQAAARERKLHDHLSRIPTGSGDEPIPF
jgi:hypothetical protein